MKKILFLILGLIAFQMSAMAGIHEIDVEKSYVKWVGTKVTGAHNGEVSIESGHFVFDGNDFVGGEVVMDMTSITVEDIKNPGTNEKLVGHLESDDFFGVKNHPMAKLSIEEVSALGDDSYDLVGEITIKGKTKEISFNAVINMKEEGPVGVAKVKVNRTDFGIRYGSGSFFENLGDKAIHDEFSLEVYLVGKK